MTLDGWAWLSIAWLVLGVVTLVTMAEGLGRNRPGTSALRKSLHRICGYAFAVLYVVFLVGMFVRLERFGPPQGQWIGWHAYLGCILFLLIAVKIAVVRRYKKYMSGVAGVGTLIVAVAFAIVAMSGGWRIFSHCTSGRVDVSYRGKTYRASIGAGKKVTYLKCARCHDLRPVYLFSREEQEWERYVKRMQDKDPELLTDEDCAHSIGYLRELE